MPPPTLHPYGSTHIIQHSPHLTYRMLDYWCRTNLIHADGVNGSGTIRQFTPTEARVAHLIAELTHWGLGPHTPLARAAAEAVRTSGKIAGVIGVEDSPILIDLDLIDDPFETDVG